MGVKCWWLVRGNHRQRCGVALVKGAPGEGTDDLAAAGLADSGLAVGG